MLKKGALSLSLLLVLILACSLSACTRPQGEQAFPIQITDQLGREVRLADIPQRIICLDPGNTEIMFALGLGDRVVGVTTYCNYPAAALDKEKIGGYSTPDIEKVVALEPDLILATSIHETQVIPELERRNLTVVALVPKTLDQVLEGITLAGQVCGEEEAAAQLVQELEGRIEAITGVTAGLSQRPRVFYITWHDPLWTSGSGTLTNDLIEKAGGENIFADITGWQTIDLETVIARNPEVIIACTGHGEARDLPFQWAQSEPRLADTEARQNGRVYQIDADLVVRHGPRVVDALEEFARFIHPEVFGSP